MASIDTGPGFLLKGAERLSGAWVNSWSVAAIPPLRRKKERAAAPQQLARDVFVLSWFLLSIAGSGLCTLSGLPLGGLRLIAAVGMYRGFDLFITLFRAGVFLSFRGDIELKSEPMWRIRRILLGIFVNYVEL